VSTCEGGGVQSAPAHKGHKPRSEAIDSHETMDGVAERCIGSTSSGPAPRTGALPVERYCFLRDLLDFYRAARSNVRGDTHA